MHAGQPKTDTIVINERLKALVEVAGPSGFERSTSEVWRDGLIGQLGIDVLPVDGHGNALATKGELDGTVLMLTAHADEIGFMVKHIDSDGFLYVAEIGGWNPQVALAQRVQVHFKDAGVWVPGVVGHTAVHMVEDLKKAVAIKDLWIDIGAGSKEEAEKYARVGSYVVIKASPMVLGTDRLTASALDNRLGCYVIQEVLRLAKPPRGQGIAALVSTREEISHRHTGSVAPGTLWIDPDAVVAVDLCPATDHPGLSLPEVGEVRLGRGPTISYGSTTSPELNEALERAALGRGIKFQREASPVDTSTDLDNAVFVGTGAPGALVGVPCRYLHSPVEVVSLADVQATIELLVEFAETYRP